MTTNKWKSRCAWKEYKPILELGKPFVVFDTETSGLSSQKNEIIELAAIKYQIDESFNMIETGHYHQYFNPNAPLRKEVIDITGITDEFLADKPLIDDHIEEIAEFFDDCVVGGHNVDFDIRFMTSVLARNNKSFNPIAKIDSYKMARNMLSKDDVENFKLSTLGDYYGIDFMAHSALEDTRATAKLIQILVKECLAEEEETAITGVPVTNKGTLRPDIKSISFWEGFKGFSRIYVNTTIGSVYYDIRNYEWGGKDNLDVTEIDMEWFTSEVFRLTNCKNETEFAHFKGKISA